MPTAWTQTALDVIQGALQLCQAVGVGENVSDEDASVCMTSLDGIMKELPIQGFSWPQITPAPVALTWNIVTPGIVTPPTDFFGSPVIKRTDTNGSLIELQRVPKQYWEALINTTPTTAIYPQYFYLASDLSIRLWPVPTVNPALSMSYQSIIPDLVRTSPPAIQQQYLNGLQFILADEISLKYGVPGDVRQELAARATQKRMMMQAWAVDLGPIEMQVNDGGYGWTSGPFSRGSWNGNTW